MTYVASSYLLITPVIIPEKVQSATKEPFFTSCKVAWSCRTVDQKVTYAFLNNSNLCFWCFCPIFELF